MPGPFGGPMAGPGECLCCGGTSPSCGNLCVVTARNCSPFPGLDGVAVVVTYQTVVSIPVTNGGGGYVAPPAVAVSTTNGSGCTAVAVLTGGVVTSINVTNGGIYRSTPSVAISGGGGVGATAGTPSMSTITLGGGASTGQVVSVNVTTFGDGYISAPGITLPGGGGTGAAATALMGITAFSVDAAGGGFTTLPTITVGGDGTGGVGIPHLTPTTVDTVILTASGSGYTTMPAVSLITQSGQTGSGATAAALMKASTVFSFSVAGSGYAVGDTIAILGGTSAVAAVLQVTAVGTGGTISSATITTPGSYSALPTNPAATSTITGSGTGATINLRWSILSLVKTVPGSNYSAQPLVVVSGGNGTGAIGTTTLVATSLASITVSGGGGTGYTTKPPVFVSGGGGAGALASVTTMKVSAARVDNGGTGYTSNPAAIFSGGSPTISAVANATIRHQYCVGMPAAGGYLFSGSAGGHLPASGSIVAATCANIAPAISLTPNTASFALAANGCLGHLLSGATFLISGGGSTYSVGPTIDTGTIASPLLPVGVSYTIVGSHERYADHPTTTVTLPACGVSYTPGFSTTTSGYICSVTNCAWPLSKTLTLNDPVYGAITLAYSPTGAFGAGWYGTRTVTYPGCDIHPCPGATGVLVRYCYRGTSGGEILIAYSSGNCPCQSGTVGCNDDGGDASTSVSTAVVTCPPSFLMTQSNPANIGLLYCSLTTFSLME